MKKIVFALCMTMLLFATTGCKKDVHMYTSYYDVTQDKWIQNNNLDYIYAAYENSDITPEVIENGCVLAYLVDDMGCDNPLPYEKFRSDSNGNLFSDTFTFDVSTGRITFKFQTSDFQNSVSIKDYGKISFKVCVMEN